MTSKFVQRGEVLNYTNGGGSTIAGGTPVLVGKRLGIALADIAVGAVGALQMCGVFTVAKLSSDTPSQGDLLYWDAGNNRLTTTASGNTLAGYCWTTPAASATTVDININE